MTDTWFITGASAGIGRELVRQALEAGENVAALARDTAELDGIDTSGRLLRINADVADEAAMHDAVQRTVARFGRIDVVANNAGYGLVGAVEEASGEKVRAIFETNVFGVLNVLRATLPVLRKQRSGRILQGSSFLGQTSAPGLGMLSATKYAVEGLSDALALETAPMGITVTLVQPGPTATAFVKNADIATSAIADYDETVRAPQPAAAGSSPERIAAGIRQAAASKNPPRRLALGVVGGEAMRAALNDRLSDLDTWTADA
jgi:NAD(P)-dependent dehydrogenase (short-subunit alcohol dehydrogenase family)